MNVKQLLTQRKADAEKAAAELRRLQLLQARDEANRIEVVMRKVAWDLKGFEFSEGQGVYRWLRVNVGDEVVYVIMRYQTHRVNGVNAYTDTTMRVLEVCIEWKGDIHITATPEIFVPIFTDFLQKNNLV